MTKKKTSGVDSPQAPEAEFGVLSSMAIDPRVIPGVIEKIGEDCFNVPAHRTIYAQLIEAWESGGLDLITFTQRFRDRNILDEVGGVGVVTSLWTFVPTSANLSNYIETVIDKSILRQVISAATDIVRKAHEEQSDVSALLATAQMEIASIKKAEKEKRKTTHELVLDKIDRMQSGEPDADVILTKIIELDRMSPLRMGDMPIISGKRKSGKSILALTILENICIGQQRPGLYFSLEDRSPKVIDRIFGGISRISMNRHHVKHLGAAEMDASTKAAEKISKANLMIRDDIFDLHLIIAESKKTFTEFPDLAVIIVDYGQLVRVVAKKGASREQEVATTSRALRLMSMETGVPVIVLSQENALGNTRESTSLEQDGTALWKIEEIDCEPKKRKLSIPFQRNGPSGVFTELCFLGEIARVENMHRPHDLVPPPQKDFI